MNLVYMPTLTPLRVMVLRPLIPSSQLTITKMLSGIVFGIDQLLDIILLVYTNELPAAREYVQELISCAFPCYNSIRCTSEAPRITDADVYCLFSDLENPNYLDIENLDPMADSKLFDILYSLIKIAMCFAKPLPPEAGKSRRKPYIVCGGLVAMDILHTFSNLPSDYFFSCTPLRSLAQTVLSDYLKVECFQINDVMVWGANDSVFHVEIKKPYLRHDKLSNESSCDWDAVGKELLESLNLDHIQFNASWMKKEFIQKVRATAEKNPYGSIYRAAEMSKTMRAMWKGCKSADKDLFTSLGVISNGALGTIKGLPYILPVSFLEDSYIINTNYDEDTHVKREIQRINVAAKDHHTKLISFCKKFMEKHVINQAFVHYADKARMAGASIMDSLLSFDHSSTSLSSISDHLSIES